MARPMELGGKGSRFVILASICVVVAALYFGREVFIPLALAVLLSFLLTPPMRWLERVLLPRWAATLVVVVVAVALVGGIGYAVGRQFASVIEQLPQYQGELQKKLAGLRKHGGFFKKAELELRSIGGGGSSTNAAKPVPAPGVLPEDLHPVPLLPGRAAPTTQYSTDNPLPVQVVTPSPTPLEFIGQYSTQVIYPLATAGLVLVFVIFMLLNREDLRDRMIRLIGHGRLNLTTQALDDTGTRISRYLGALAIVNGLYAACVAAGLWMIGHFLGGKPFPNVLVWGLLVGLFRFVPYVGIWIGAAVPLILSFALYPGSAVFFATVGLFAALELSVSQFVEPFWYGASTGMSALAVLVAAVFWTWLWGPIGLLLSTPLTVCLVVIGKYVPQLQFLDIILGDEPVLPPHVRVYQRLIASDEEEAAELSREYLKDHSIEALYDRVLLPALVLAEHDHHRGRLDEQRLGFVRQSMRDLVEETGEEARAQTVRQAAAETEQIAKDQTPRDEPRAPHLTIPADCSINVLILPAKGMSDEIVSAMLAQLLQRRGYCATETSADALASEMVEHIAREKADIVCVSAMPPSAISHARYLCKRVHARFPETNMVVGLWLAQGDLQKAAARIACSDSVRPATTLEHAQQQIDELAQPLMIRAAATGAGRAAVAT